MGKNAHLESYACLFLFYVFLFYFEVRILPFSLDKNILLENMNKPIDFYTGKELQPDDISVDHVIPWSFMYSDDIWNLVITSKSKNSSKSNSVVNEAYIKKLKDRNTELINYTDEHYKLELLEANENMFIDKYYFQFKV